jgi:tetratricopeptide (TPR) repeat protein
MSQLSLQDAIDLALDHHRAGRLHQAEQLYRQVLAVQPNHPWALQLLGMIAYQAGDPKLAVELIQRAINVDPNIADFHNNLGEVYRNIGMPDRAEESFKRCLALNDNFAPAYSNLGEVYRERNELERAAEQYRKALAIEPDNPAPLNNLGIATHDLGFPHAAIELYQKALSLRPNYPDAMNNLGTSLLDLRRVDEAIATFRQAIALEPHHPDAHSNLSYALILKGEYEEGWEEYEWRWRCSKFPSPRRNFPQPLWNGEDPAGKRILVYGEQGLGDAIQFVRYVPIMAKRGATVIVECQAPLVPLFKTVEGISELIAQGNPLPAVDYQIPMLSLPRAFKTRVDTVPAEIPYVHAEPVRVEQWRQKLGERDGSLRVALVWAGTPTHLNDRHRSIPLTKLAPLARVSNVKWFTLQFGPRAQETRSAGMDLIDMTGEIRDFADSAALLSALDLLISVDTSPAHLAGALGRDAWMLSPFNGDWRWGMASETTAWYPTLRIFRQERFGVWENVIERVATELAKRAQEQRH